METKIWLSSPHMGGGEMKYIQQAFDENWIAPLGPNVNAFEADLEGFLENNVHVAALSSGTAALHLALVLLDVKAGDEVICQSLTFAASANCIRYCGAIPVFIDSERDTWNMCPILLEEAIVDRIKKGKKPKAIMVVCLYGMPYQVEAIHSVAQKYEIPIIEDSAEALGSSYKGRMMGTFGDYSVLSFNGNKIITTSGGGALVTKSKENKQRAIFFATQAKENTVHYEHTEVGYNYRMSNVAAGIGRGQMEVLSERINQRRSLNQFYGDLLKSKNGVLVFKEPSGLFFSNHWLTALVLGSGLAYTPEDLRLELERHNVEARPLWKPMHLQPVFAAFPKYENGISENLFNSGLCLPSGSNLTDSQKQKIGNILLDYLV